jgi:methanogenic corrinoid protein MtbC1
MGQSNRDANEAFDNRQFGESSNAGTWQGNRTSRPVDTQELAADILAGSNNKSTVSVLARTIQNEIIPRLMMAHRTPAECIITPSALPYVVLESDVDHFVDLLLACDQDGALAWISNARAKGVSVESVFLNVLAPAARKLGELWEEDERDFTEVALGLGELHNILHLIPSLHDMQSHRAPNGLSILLAPAPGDQHTLGLAMVAEFFQRDGWTVAGGTSADSEDPAELMKASKYDVVGFSLATSGGFQRLEKCISEVRKAAGSHKVCIIVGGPFFTAHPEKVSLVGADLVLQDANLAPDLVQEFIQSATYEIAH